MATLVFLEIDEGSVKKSSFEAISYASAINAETTAVAFGDLSADDLAKIGKAGATKLLHVTDAPFAQPNSMAYASALAEAMEKTGADTLVLAKSSLGDAIAARTSVKLSASLISNVTSLPGEEGGFSVRKSIYTGKAFANTQSVTSRRVLTLRKNAALIREDGQTVAVEGFQPTVRDADFNVKVLSREKATGEILLPEADIVVSGGRGMKGPENWNLIEGLAQALGAATGCSKPVSDMDWRPHREHVGQTGLKVAPSLYIAVGISGAIQHLAGVNSSKYILVINKDPEAPFFKAADYGVVGDAFEVLPRLTEAVKAQLG
ncbi:MAG: electron transfer flavoprotein subunit alpha/FixB family protein [Cyclobacteriaceae bacterium]|nr:electron transfer flavoprotein subunit alpha/FixB family protein [Cyclobacteriaceae bacterium]